MTANKLKVYVVVWWEYEHLIIEKCFYKEADAINYINNQISKNNYMIEEIEVE